MKFLTSRGQHHRRRQHLDFFVCVISLPLPVSDSRNLARFLIGYQSRYVGVRHHLDLTRQKS